MKNYAHEYALSVNNPSKYWLEQSSNIAWSKTPTRGCSYNWESTKGTIFTEWFADGELNITVSCLDKHAQNTPEKVALLWQGEQSDNVHTYTYKQLLEAVCQCAHMLTNLGIKTGDIIALFMPMIPETYIATLACARIGAVHSIIFSGLSAHALATRLNDLKAQTLITAASAVRNGKNIPLLDSARQARACSPSITKTVVINHDEQSSLESDEYNWHTEINNLPKTFEPVIRHAEDALFILYTSGSTGKPKGLVHTCGGYILYASMTHKQVFDIQPEDVYWCTADIGWITGHSYGLYGPLSNGCTSILFEGVPTYPQPDRYWQIIQKYRVTKFYTAPTVIRLLAQAGTKWLEPYDLSSLKILGSVGEPLDPTSWQWYHTHVGKNRCHIVDTWWQTETGGVMLCALPGEHKTQAGTVGQPFYGIKPTLVSATEDRSITDLCITQPWPGIARTIFNDHDAYAKTYFTAHSGMYTSGDGAFLDHDNYVITGRIDDVLNVSGHRISSAEIEGAIVKHPTCAEAAVVGQPHPIKGEGIAAFVVLSADCIETAKLLDEINLCLRSCIGPIAKVDFLYVVEGLPKTRSGKVMRRILRKIVHGTTDIVGLGDISTLLNPEIISEIINKIIHG
ncbi:MAG: Acetyl-coenzyme A synthetase [candidate division TM6 bacterium GW2011_GWE2_41_16]|nr:MAG: Acetyl-coenzyme A synthetase [candidate division TM6 bacterium GW2011_GWE2_41_16]